MVNIDNIKRNSKDFSFVDTLGSFVNNYEFGQGYEMFRETGELTKEGYIWAAISAIGGNYAETIYENVLNYIDNVSNVDLCKVKNLQSMIKILGIDYNIINDVEAMPVELVNLIDILSINKRYLVDNKTFSQAFMQELSSYDGGKCFTSADFYSTLETDIGPKLDPSTGEEILAKDVRSRFNEVSTYLDNDKYYSFLTSTYRQVLTSYVFMQYADAEAGLSTLHDYIYEYIADKLLAKSNVTTSTDDSYDKEIRLLKLRYRLEKFKQDEVVDAIEDGKDYIDRYNAYLQIIIKKEIERRNASYPYDKLYEESLNDLGFSITRYSYYREKKVREYFDFIENTYNSLIRADEIYSSVLGTGTTNIEVYDKDVNYFDVDLQDKKNLLWYDTLTKSYSILVKYINAVALLLADLTLELADIRDLIKIQLRKSYLKGTFLLLSYIINEYLKYNVSKHYGDVFYSDDNVALSTFINRSITEGENVELIEYYDTSEYFNISSDTDLIVEDLLSSQGVKIKNKSLANEKFWDNLNSKIGETTRDLPLGEIDNFYRKQLKMNLNGIETSANLVNFLSIIYSYGANDTFWDETNDLFMCQVQSQDLSGREWMGDIDKALSASAEQESLVLSIIDEVNLQIANGFVLLLNSVGQQVKDLSNFVSSHWCIEISSANKDFKDLILDTYDSYIETNEQTSVDLLNLRNDFYILSSNSKYKVYLSGYHPSGMPLTYFFDLLSTFRKCVNDATVGHPNHGISVENGLLKKDIDTLSTSYLQVKSDLSDLIEKYVKAESNWPYYFTNSNDEITALTRDLASYLLNESDQVANNVHEHLQNHLEKLIAYKEDVNNMIEVFHETSAMFDNFKQLIFAYTNTDSSAGSLKFKVWVYDKLITNPANGEYWKKNSAFVYDAGGLQELTVSWSAIPSSPIPSLLTALADRCNTWFYYLPAATRQAAYVYGGDVWYVDGAYTNATIQKWAAAYSAVTAANITSNLNLLVTDFSAVLTMINIELDCLGSAIGSISVTGVTTDNVGDKLNSLFTQLLAKIKTLDDTYVKVKKFVTTDHYYTSLASKLDVIQWILNSSPKRESRGSIGTISNIKRIEDDFNAVLLSFNDKKNANKDYLLDYSDPGIGNLDELFTELKRWIISNDEANKQAILKGADSIVSEHNTQFAAFKSFVSTLSKTTITGVTDDLVFLTKVEPYDGGSAAYFDPYLVIVASWIASLITTLEDRMSSFINAKVPNLQAFKDTMALVYRLAEFLATNWSDVKYLTSVLEEFLEVVQARSAYIESSRESYDAQKEIFLKYSGMNIGYDPFYNYKNMTHSSYLIHPYLYNFIEKSNLSYPLANTFFVSFGADYEKELIEKNLDDMIGRYGNIINLWKHGMFDWTGYLSQYEFSSSGVDIKTVPESFGFTGAFYPPVLDLYLADSETFIQLVQDNRPESPYYKLNLSQEQLNKISNLLRIYESAIREIALKPKRGTLTLQDPCLSCEYDIYKYAEDIYGNSLILFKSYKHIIDMHAKKDHSPIPSEDTKIKQNYPGRWVKNRAGEWEYHPSYNEKKNAPGELWVRVKNHPIAFPAFDVREEDEEYTFYDSSEDYKHEYILAVNKYFGNARYMQDSISYDGYGHSLFEITRDALSRGSNKDDSHFRCFFDMDLDVAKKTILLVAPYQTGQNHLGTKAIETDRPNIWLTFDTFTYANSNIIVGSIGQEFDYSSNLYRYTFTLYANTENSENVTNNIDNIKSPLPLVRAKVKTIPQEVYDFVGFSKHGTFIYAVFVHKYYPSMLFKAPRNPNSPKQLHMFYVGFNGSKLQKMHAYQDLLYDILKKDEDDYKYANTLTLATNVKGMTLSYISEEFLVVKKVGSRGLAYSDDTVVVNFAEYTAMVEDDDRQNTCGLNKKYPSDTAVLQTTDSAHINIYNSFDSFTSYIVNVGFKFVGKKMVSTEVKHFNLNTDIGYMPLFADTTGKSRFWNNSALSGNEMYKLELLGPENSDVDYTPVILDQEDDRFGRVTEDWKEQSKVTAFTGEIEIPAFLNYATFSFDLKDVFVDSRGKPNYDELAEKNLLTTYSYTFTNLAYTALPIAKGKLKDLWPLSNFYLSSEKYDLLSGQEILGPNGTSYQGIKASNHIDNISAIQLEVKFDSETSLPVSVDVSCFTRLMSDEVQKIQENKFMLLLYAKNNLGSYDYYHIIENANKTLVAANGGRMTRQEENEIVFSEISSLSDFCLSSEIPGDNRKPFANLNASAKKASEMSAFLEFKYSEDETVNREFPYLPTEDVEDEVVIMSNENLYIYFYAIDSFDTIGKDIFYMDRYDIPTRTYKRVKVNTTSRKYQDFYNRALTIEATYNIEDFGEDPENGKHKYEIVQYFNYKNFTSPSYLKFSPGTPDASGKYPTPSSLYYSSTAKEIEHTYLVLRPGQSGRLDILFDYVEYAKIYPTDITLTVVGKETRVVRTYYIMNVSDEKPKFIVSRSPFKA